MVFMLFRVCLCVCDCVRIEVCLYLLERSQQPLHMHSSTPTHIHTRAHTQYNCQHTHTTCQHTAARTCQLLLHALELADHRLTLLIQLLKPIVVQRVVVVVVSQAREATQSVTLDTRVQGDWQVPTFPTTSQLKHTHTPTHTHT